MQNLLKLSCGNNVLTTFPKELGKLEKLANLSAPGNEIDSIPVEIIDCEELETIDLSNNNLTKLPRQIGGIPALTDIDLKGNPIQGAISVMSKALQLLTLRETFRKAEQAKVTLENDAANIEKWHEEILSLAYG
jgi:Leucine-rich repeat (LRR) protein